MALRPVERAVTRICLFDADHTRRSGEQNGSTTLLSKSGDAMGSSSRYAGTAQLGQSAWPYTRPAPRRPASASSTRAACGTTVDAVWLYDPSDAASTRIGLFDAAHTHSGGSPSSVGSLAVDSFLLLLVALLGIARSPS
jgi:hypothetical protein